MLKMDVTNLTDPNSSYSLKQTFSCHSVHKLGAILVNPAAPWQQTLNHSTQTDW